MRTKSPDARLYVQCVCVNIKEKEILKNVSMVTKTGEMLAIMGPTGSGKTTLLNAISGRQKYHTGSITLNGQNFDKLLRRWMAFIHISCDGDTVFSDNSCFDEKLLQYFGTENIERKEEHDGSGKTTLLNAISGRQKYHTGSITLNGQHFDKQLRRRMAFVQQQDVFFSQLTLIETLRFTAQLRMSDRITMAEKESIIDDIVDRLHIKSCLNTVIGDVFTKGLSGGEKKRASIACELLVDPDILMLDEPTSGLDSSTAYDIMSCLQTYARDFNKMIIITIHQPASRIFHMFNNLLLLTKGHIAYFGSVDGALPYFKELDLYCGVHYNPADFLLEMVTSDDETIKRIVEKGTSTRFRRKSQTSLKIKPRNGKDKEIITTDLDEGSDITEGIEKDDSKTQLLVNGDGNQGHTVHFDDYDMIDDDIAKWPNSWCTQYRVLAGRSLKQTLRVIKQGYTLTTAAIVSVACCLMYTQIGVSLQTSRDVYGLIFFYGGYWTFLPAMEIISSFPSVRLVINKERASGAYRLSALYCALMTSDIPSCFLHPVFMYTIFFWVGGFGGAGQFFSSLLCYMLHTFACYGLGLFISAMCHDLRMAITTLFSYLISMYLLGGFFSQNIPSWMTWIKYVSIFYYPYSYSITIISEQIPDTPCNETSVVTFPQCADNSTSYITSQQVLEKANVFLPQYFYISVIFVYTIALRIAGYLMLRFKRSNPV